MADESDFERGYAKGFKEGFEAGAKSNQQTAVSPPQFSSLFCAKCGRNLNVPGGVVCSMAGCHFRGAHPGVVIAAV